MLLSFLLLLAAPQTQAQMTQSAGTSYASADAAMTRQWQATYAAMKRRDAQDMSRGGGYGFAAALLEGQRAWLKYRDTECVIEGGRYAGGSMLPMGDCGVPHQADGGAHATTQIADVVALMAVCISKTEPRQVRAV